MSRIMRLTLLLSTLVVASTWSAAQYDNCANYDAQDAPVFWDPWDTTGHKTGGYHQFLSTLTGSCTYNTIYQQNCSNISYSYGSVSGQDTGWGTITNPLYNHYLGQTAKAGTSEAPLGGATTTSQVTVAVAAESCNVVTGCTVAVTVSAGASGVGATVSFPPSSIFATDQALQTICPNEPDPTYGEGGGSGFDCTCGDGPPECPLYMCELLKKRNSATMEHGINDADRKLN